MSDTIREALRLIRNSKQESEALAALARLEVDGRNSHETWKATEKQLAEASSERDKYRDALRAYETAVQRALRVAPNHWHNYRDPLELGTEIHEARKLGRAALRDDTAAVAPETPQERPWCECDPDYDGRCTDPCQLEARARAVPSGDAEERCVYPKCIGWDGECNSVCDGGPPTPSPAAPGEEHDG